MKTLLHICCAPCSIACIQSLRAEGCDPDGLFYNPNIHGALEYKTRRNTLVEYAKTIGLPLTLAGEYGLREFLAGVPDFDNRCAYCYETRLEYTARHAAAHGYDSFLTTLLVSPYQNYGLLCRTGHEMARKYGVSFLERDFRPLFRAGQEEARALGLYLQKYCGCIFSEEDRYRKRKKKPKTEETA